MAPLLCPLGPNQPSTAPPASVRFRTTHNRWLHLRVLLYSIPMNALTCVRCKAPRDDHDNFCRSCGHQFTVNLPAVSEPRLPARTLPSIPPALVGSVALLAVGTTVEWLTRRLAGTAAKAAGKALVTGVRPSSPARRASNADVTISEVVYIRKVEVRR